MSFFAGFSGTYIHTQKNLGLGFVYGFHTQTQTQNQTILGIKHKAKPKFFFHLFFELINVFSFKIFNFEMNS